MRIAFDILLENYLVLTSRLQQVGFERLFCKRLKQLAQVSSVSAI